MEPQRFVVMGAGQVGFHLARLLSQDGHQVTVIEAAADRRARIDEELDVLVVGGNGAHVPVLEQAQVDQADLFLAVSSSDEANLAAAHLARHLGAARSVVRVAAPEGVIGHRRVYEEVFGVDLMLSTQLLTTTRILNLIRGHTTTAVESFAEGRVELRRVEVEPGSLLARRPLRELELPAGSLVVAFFHGDTLTIPSGDDHAEAGDEALVLASTEVIAKVERLVTPRPAVVGTIVIAGGGSTGQTVARALHGGDYRVRIIERDRAKAGEVAAAFPRFQVLHGDATDLSLLKAEGIDAAGSFIAVTGNDDSNLMASLLARDLGIEMVAPLVERAETFELWQRLGLTRVFSPRVLAYEHIAEYIASGYSANIVSLSHGEAVVLERRLYEPSPAAGVTLAEISPPRGMIVGAVVRGRRVFVPRGADRLEVGDVVILFVKKEELGTVQLLFPGRDTAGQAA